MSPPLQAMPLVGTTIGCLGRRRLTSDWLAHYRESIRLPVTQVPDSALLLPFATADVTAVLAAAYESAALRRLKSAPPPVLGLNAGFETAFLLRVLHLLGFKFCKLL